MESAKLRADQFRDAIYQNEVEIHKKFAISIACIVFVLVGAPIAVRFPRGGVGLVIGFSLVIFAIYYIGLIAGESLADRGIMTPFWAMWAANIILTLAGLVLLARMGRESATSRGGDIRDLLDTVRGLFRFGRRREVEPA
jgi:lipopolysaccharide export system permease protein